MKAQNHDEGIRAEGGRVQLIESVKGQLADNAGVVDVEDDFSRC